MRVLMTGANGHLGANTVRALLSHGYEVAPFVRPTSDLRGLEGLGLSYRYGDVIDRESLIAAAAGCQVIIHSAAVFRYWVNDPDEVIRPALEGARNVFAAAEKQGVGRVIYTSSTYAVGFSDDPEKPLTEDHWNDDPRTAYSEAKTRAEQEAWRLSEQHGVPLISLCPGGTLGPYDFRVTPAMSWIRDMVNGMMPIIKIGGNFVDVRDVAEVHALAVSGGQPGQRYIIAGDNLLMTEIAAIVRRLTGARLVYFPVGRPLIRLSAGFLELAGRISGKTPLVTRGFADEAACRYQYADGRKAELAFGIQTRPAEAMIRDAIRWLLFLGVIKPRQAVRLSGRFPPDPAWTAPAGTAEQAAQSQAKLAGR